MEMLHLPKK